MLLKSHFQVKIPTGSLSGYAGLNGKGGQGTVRAAVPQTHLQVLRAAAAPLMRRTRALSEEDSCSAIVWANLETRLTDLTQCHFWEHIECNV